MLRGAFGTTLTRVALGIILIAHGYVLKISTYTIAGTVGYVNYPFSSDHDVPSDCW